MGRSTKYFLFNKPLDFERCFMENMQYKDGSLTVIGEEGHNSNGLLISRVLDSKEVDMEWHQLYVRLENEGNTAFTIYIYATNTLMRQIGEKEESIEYVLYDKELSWKQKKFILKPYLQKTVMNRADILLHDIAGRYVWFAIEVSQQTRQRLSIEKIKLLFPRKSWLSYLPEIYQSNDRDQFFERFLAVFQTMYEKVNDEITDMPYMFDVDGADKKFLRVLAGWLDIRRDYMWNDEQLRTLLKRAIEIYKLRGTRYAVEELVKLYVGNEHVYLVEHFQIKNCMTDENRVLMGKLYGNDPYKFQVLVRLEDVPTLREYQTLVQIIEEVKPAYTELELVVLKPYIFVNEHTYLGINSVLSEYQNISLDGSSMVSFTVLGEEGVKLE